jgi:hypothetical protein
MTYTLCLAIIQIPFCAQLVKLSLSSPKRENARTVKGPKRCVASKQFFIAKCYLDPFQVKGCEGRDTVGQGTMKFM